VKLDELLPPGRDPTTPAGPGARGELDQIRAGYARWRRCQADLRRGRRDTGVPEVA
jgi:hypothetical protein